MRKSPIATIITLTILLAVFSLPVKAVSVSGVKGGTNVNKTIQTLDDNDISATAASGWTFQTAEASPAAYKVASCSVFGASTSTKMGTFNFVNFTVSMWGKITASGTGTGPDTYSITATRESTIFYIEAANGKTSIPLGETETFNAKEYMYNVGSGAKNSDWAYGLSGGGSQSGGEGTSFTTPTSLSAGSYTISASPVMWAESTSDSKELKVVEVASVSATPTGGIAATSTTDVEENAPSAYVQEGKSVALSAIPNPSGDWPSLEDEGYPIWSGGISGRGPNQTFTKADTDDGSNCGVYTMTATCGNSKKIKVVVADIIASPVITVPNTSATRTTIGVGETVAFALFPLNAFSNVVYSISSGNINTSNGSFTAPNRAATITLTATASGMTFTKQFTVVEPSGAVLVRQPNTGIWHEQDKASCGFQGNYHITPANVSFEAISTQEQYCLPTTASGFLSSKASEAHRQGSWVDIGAVVAGIGSKSTGTDTVASGAYPGPFSVGTFAWVIDVHFRVGNTDAGKKFTTMTHKEVVDANGKLTISKGGLSFSKNASDPNSSY